MINRLQRVPWKSLPAWLFGERLHIWMYHSISDNPGDPHAIPPEQFSHQMQALYQSKHQVLSLQDSLERLRGHQSLRNYVVLTFDDAYRNFLTHALPILERFNYPATLFVPTGLVGSTSTWDSHDQEKPLLTWPELAEVARRGISLASHTVSHARLTECNAETLEFEIRQSLQTLRLNASNVFPALAFPGGYFGSREIAAVRQAGYLCAVGIASRWANGSETDPFQLRRERPPL